jgi:hypothetical protein
MDNGRNTANALNTPGTIAHQQLAVHELVAGNFVSLE